jgi:aldehyde:ferredoxin oxidoreductase
MEANTPEIQYKATDLLNKYGLNVLEVFPCLYYSIKLNLEGVLGPGKEIDCPLNFDDRGSFDFIDQFLKMITYRNDGRGNESEYGNDIAEGIFRAAMKWGRLEKDLETGDLDFPYWGIPNHYDPRTQLEWGYGTILGDRDINEHGIQRLYAASDPKYYGDSSQLTTEEIVTIVTNKMVPFQDDPLMLDYSTDNMYSEHMVKLVAWHRYYTRFWQSAVIFCEKRWPDFINPYAPDMIGSTGEAEPKFYNVVTGKNITFLDGIELGRRIWNLDHAIWTLQGRHRDMVHFADYIYTIPRSGKNFIGREAGEWTIIEVDRCIDREKFEEFKTLYYELEGWDPATGYPTRGTLEALDLAYVADELKENGKLGES